MRQYRYRRNFGLHRQGEAVLRNEFADTPVYDEASESGPGFLPNARALRELPSRVSHSIDERVNASPAASILLAVMMGFLLGKLLTS